MSFLIDQLKGGMFILNPADYSSMFIPEERSEEQDMIYQSARDYVESEIHPRWKRIEQLEEGLSEAILKEMGDLGLLGAHMPIEYGGSDLDSNTITLLLTAMGSMGSFNTPYAAHTGIGMLPILYFGTEEQKQKYLPPMISGDLIGSYCLTEPTSGSDALSAKTHAFFDKEKGKYILNGQKMWITNAGFAGVFVVFAQVDGDKFSAFIVERGVEGLTFGAEEEKMGIHGSSTRQVFFENVEVDENAILGEIGKGHLIAFNVLNMGRFKMGPLCLASSMQCLKLSSVYANERHQFGRPIASFGAIKTKLAWQASFIAALQSATYRISSMLTEKVKELKSSSHSSGESKLAAAKEFAIECSIIKVAASDILDYVVDETVQIFGGMGYSEEAEPARIYRNSRINRIYEGTNEINRILIVDQLFKRGMKGQLPLMDVIMKGEVVSEIEKYCVEANSMRNVILKLLGYLGKRQMDGKLNLEEEQEVTMALSDIGIYMFLLESLWMRMMKRKDLGLGKDYEWRNLYNLYHFHAFKESREPIYMILSHLFSGEDLKSKNDKLCNLLILPNLDIVQCQREVADWIIEEDGAVF